jgi:hypothetical protein
MHTDFTPGQFLYRLVGAYVVTVAVGGNNQIDISGIQSGLFNAAQGRIDVFLITGVDQDFLRAVKHKVVPAKPPALDEIKIIGYLFKQNLTSNKALRAVQCLNRDFFWASINLFLAGRFVPVNPARCATTNSACRN